MDAGRAGRLLNFATNVVWFIPLSRPLNPSSRRTHSLHRIANTNGNVIYNKKKNWHTFLLSIHKRLIYKTISVLHWGLLGLGLKIKKYLISKYLSKDSFSFIKFVQKCWSDKRPSGELAEGKIYGKILIMFLAIYVSFFMIL